MLSKTHMVIGLAASFTALMPATREAVLPVVIGGAVGSIIPDIDLKDRTRDAAVGRVAAFLLSVLAVLYDAHTGGKLTGELLSLGAEKLVGLCILFLTATAAMFSGHRGFSHSIIAGGLYTIGLVLFLPGVMPAFLIAYTTHILLDLTNKRPVKVLFPAKRGYCLRWCVADRRANAAVMALGCVWLVFSVWRCGLLRI